MSVFVLEMVFSFCICIRFWVIFIIQQLQYIMTTAMTIDDVNDRIGCRMMLVMNMMMIMMRLMKAR